MRQKKSLRFRIFTAIVVLLAILASMFFIYTGSYYKAGNLALNNLKADNVVQVEYDGDLIFRPVSNAKDIGFIFYPGGKVEASAYAPIAREVASNGYTVIIAKMNFNLAILSPNKAYSIISKNTKIRTWAIGGHSLGGVMAADYAFKNDKIKGLVLLASYAQKERDFTNKNIKVLSLWGENDKVADLNKVKDCKSLMPGDSEFQVIKGGNHGGFGDYGHQKGDGEASITNEQQMHTASEEIVKLLNKFA